jgi:hypothetical protein
MAIKPPSTVADRFVANTEGWQRKLQADEWFFANLRADLVGSLSAPEAFENIGGIVELAINENDPTLCMETAELLLDLARRSDTVELHPSLERHWSKIMSHLASLGEYGQTQAKRLTTWYRR